MVEYHAVKEQHILCNDLKYTAWGIEGVISSGKERKPAVYIKDVFLNKSEADTFAKQCTVMGLSIIHLHEVVEDYVNM